MIRELLQRNRTYRRFDESIKIDEQQIEHWVESARYTASMRNVQPIKYIIVTDEGICHKLCEAVTWAGYLTDWDGPSIGERPTAFLVQLLDTELSSSARFDEGLQLAAITLSAVEAGYGACITLSFNTADIMRLFQLGEHLFPLSITALGKPIETVVIEDVRIDGNIKYYHTPDGTHHVPKRSLEELIYRKI